MAGLWFGNWMAASAWSSAPGVIVKGPSAIVPLPGPPASEAGLSPDAPVKHSAKTDEAQRELKDWLGDLARNRRIEDLLAEIRRMPPGEARGSAMHDLAKQWFGLDQEATLTWIGTLSDGEEKTMACRGLVSGWCPVDSAGVSGWVEALPAGTFKDAMGSCLSYNLSHAFADRSAALSWAIASRNDKEGGSIVRESIESLAGPDIEGASRVIEASALSDQEKGRLREAARATWNQEQAIRGRWDLILSPGAEPGSPANP